MVVLQHMLEDMCQSVGMKYFSEIMHIHGWTTPRSLGLTSWIKFVRETGLVERPNTFADIEKSKMKHVLTSVSQIRHCAAHRLSQNMDFTRTSLEASLSFAQLHLDSLVEHRVQQLIQSFQTIEAKLLSQRARAEEDLRLRFRQIADQQTTLEERAIRECREQNGNFLAEAGEEIAALIANSIPLDWSPVNLSKIIHSQGQCESSVTKPSTMSAGNTNPRCLT